MNYKKYLKKQAKFNLRICNILFDTRETQKKVNESLCKDIDLLKSSMKELVDSINQTLKRQNF